MSVLDWFRPLLGGGDPEAAGAAQNSMAMQPNVLDYAQRVLSGQVAANGVLAQQRAPYDLDKPLRENLPEISPQAIDIAMGIGPGAIRAFHGSPHDFARFDMSKLGTGEGSQAFGHGLYFAEAEPVAQAYRGVQGNAAANPAANVAQKSLLAGHDPATALRAVFPGITDDAIAQAVATAKAPPSGKMYEVNINAEPEAFIDWDKPFRDQPRVAASLPEASQSIMTSDRPAGEFLRRAYNNRYFAGDYFGGGELSPEQLSQRFAGSGVPGIRFLDAGSRGAGDGTRNLVVFDDKLVEILRKYGILGPAMLGLGAGAYGQQDSNL